MPRYVNELAVKIRAQSTRVISCLERNGFLAVLVDFNSGELGQHFSGLVAVVPVQRKLGMVEN